MDSMSITILDDGSIKVETDRISGPNHMTAEAFLRDLERLGGTKQDRKHKRGRLGAARHALQHALGHGHTH